MPPKTKITREDIIAAATDLVRRHGSDALNARAVAVELKCSTQPVFSNFATMGQLREAVIDSAYSLYRAYLKKEAENSAVPPYKASGMAYIRFAREEKELFKLLFMRDRTSEQIPDSSAELEEMSDVVQSVTGLSKEDAFRFHLEMWVYVHGLATMTATGYLDWDRDMVSDMLTDVYMGLVKRYRDKE